MGGWTTYSSGAVLALGLAACGGEAPECGAAECADICAQADAPAAEPAKAKSPEPKAEPAMTAFESKLIGPLMADVQAGVRPFSDDGIGLCKGATKECGAFLGRDAGELKPGEYSVQARLRVPNVGPKGTWTVRFQTQCETTASDGTVRPGKPYERTFDVIYAGEDRGYTLAPLYKVTSPGDYGAASCTWSLTAPHPDGDKIYEGSWSVPAK